MTLTGTEKQSKTDIKVAKKRKKDLERTSKGERKRKSEGERLKKERYGKRASVKPENY